MFEDLGQTVVGPSNVDLNIDKLVNLYKQSQIYQHLVRNTTNGGVKKKLLRDHKTRRKLLKRIEQQLNDPLKPEESFEIWNQQKHLSVYKRLSYNLKEASYNSDLVDKALADDIDEDELDEITRLETKTFGGKTASEFFESLPEKDDYTQKTIMDFRLMVEGYELLPSNNQTLGFLKYHILNLMFFLHCNILLKRWDLAYKIFCILIRLPNMDIRNIWPLGVEILKGKQQQNRNNLFKSKEKRFFSWLSSFYILTSSKPTVSSNAPTFKSGSHTHVPIYVVDFFWGLLDDGDYVKVVTDLETLMTRHPYSEEGVFPFILALCYLAENFHLCGQYTSKENLADDIDSILQKINLNFDKMEIQLESCKRLNFVYPRDIIDEQKTHILDKIRQVDEGKSIDDSDESEDSLSELSSESDSSGEYEDAGDKTTVVIESGPSQNSPVSIEQSAEIPEQNSEEEEIPDQYSDEEEIPDQYSDEEEIPDQYSDEEEIPDQYSDEEEIPDQYSDEVAPQSEDAQLREVNETNKDNDVNSDFDFEFE